MSPAALPPDLQGAYETAMTGKVHAIQTRPGSLLAEDGRSPGLLATPREIRVVEERHIASRDHAEGDPHREVVGEEGKADRLERRAQQFHELPHGDPLRREIGTHKAITIMN